jgi:hypothetical protein
MTDIERRKRAVIAVTKWQKKNPDKKKLYAKRVWARHGKLYNDKLKAKSYGISIEAYGLLKCLHRSCAICGNSCKTGRQLAIDHCHKTGEVRALLCADCNGALGHFKDDPRILRKAADYVESYFMPETTLTKS